MLNNKAIEVVPDRWPSTGRPCQGATNVGFMPQGRVTSCHQL